jgi:uncharacterized protein
VNYPEQSVEQVGHRFVISELSRTECLVQVFGPGAGQRLSDFSRFFHAPYLRIATLSAAAHARAAAIRGAYHYTANPGVQPKRYGLADALHLATAIESGCDRFLTNDAQLANFSDIVVEELPP